MSKVPCGPCDQQALNAKAHIQQQRANEAPAPLRASSAGLEVLNGKKTQGSLDTPKAETLEVETHKDVPTPEEQPQPEAVAEVVAVKEVVKEVVEEVAPTQPKRTTRTKASVTTTVEP